MSLALNLLKTCLSKLPLTKHSIARTAAVFSLAVVSVCGISAPAAAAVCSDTLLRAATEYPQIVFTYANQGSFTYAAGSKLLTLQSYPSVIWQSPSTARPVAATGTPATRSLEIRIEVDSNGTLVGGTAGDDLVVRGQIDLNADGIVDYAGVLLTGEIKAFGSLDTGTVNDRFDFIFTPTGGSLLSFYSGKYIYVDVTSEASTFTCDFNSNFTGSAKGRLSPTPKPCSGKIGDYVWHDENRNGLQDAGETPLPGISVNLLNNTGAVKATATTDSNGFYQFSDLCAGDYAIDIVESTLPAGYTPTLVDAGNDAFDSDGPLNGDPVAVNLPNDNTQIMTVDFGYVSPCTGKIGDFVWHDMNRDGSQFGEENAGIQNIRIDLLDSYFQTIASTLTGANGQYQFTGLCPGSYQVDVIESTLPAGYFPSAPNSAADDIDSDGPVDGSAVDVILTHNQGSDLTIDFGYESPCTGSIGDFVWLDGNSNGLQDDGSASGLSGLMIKLYKSNGTELATSTTNGPGGYYQFTGLCAGDYRVDVIENFPFEYVPTSPYQGGNDTDSNGPENGSYASVSLPTDDSHDPTIDFGYKALCAASIGDYIWEDQNHNGIQDGTEPGIANVSVVLKDSAGTPIANAITNSAGGYKFAGLCRGTYYVDVNDSTLPPGFIPTWPLVGEPTTDSNGPSDGGPVIVVLESGTSQEKTIDFGYYNACLGTIGNYVWNDANRNGLQDTGELPLTDIMVILNGPEGSFNTMTNASGFYQFTNLCPGSYKVAVVPPTGYALTPVRSSEPLQDGDANESPQLVISNTDTNNTIDFGLYNTCLGTIGNYVWNDANRNGNQDAGELPLAGILVTINGPNGYANSMMTTPSGFYQFSGLCPGDYDVAVIPPPGYALTPVRSSDPLQDGDANESPQLVISNTDSNDSIDFGLYDTCQGSIGNYVWNDANRNGNQDAGELPLAGILVTINGPNGYANSMMTTPSGFYQFSGLCPGDYDVAVIPPPGYALTPVRSSNPILDGDANESPQLVISNTDSNDSIDFGLYDTCQGSIGNYVWNDANRNGNQDAGELPLAGILVTINGPNGYANSMMTTPSGFYQFSGLCPGDYDVAVIPPPGYALTPVRSSDPLQDGDANESPQLVISNTDINDTIDFGLYLLPASVGDYVWNDANKNGQQDAGEMGIPNVTVKLVNCATNTLVATKATDANGKYLFENLMPGNYRVEFSAPMGYAFTAKDLGNDASDSDANSAGVTDCFDLAAGQNNLTVDAGLYHLPASVGDYVWNDANKNGQQDAGEMGIPNVLVKLFNCATNALVATKATGANGKYLFENLMPGNYRVEFSAPMGYAFTAKDLGNDASDSDANSAGVTDCFDLAAGQTNLTVDAGLYLLTASVGDYVWNDANKNGIQDANEAGISGVKVELFTCAGVFVGMTTTSSSGLYNFTNLAPGSYYLKFSAPAGYAFSPKDQGINDSLDSDADPTNGQTACFNLLAGQNDTSWDAGLFKASFGCTYTIGYWKNHAGFGPQSDAMTPLLPINLGTSGGAKTLKVTTTKIGVDVLNQNVYGTSSNGITKLYAQLLAAKLNIKAGADPAAVAGIIAEADKLLALRNHLDLSKLTSIEKANVALWHATLDQYNNGLLGPGHCGSELLVPCIDMTKKISVDNGKTWLDADTELTAALRTATCTVQYKLEIKNCGQVPLTSIAVNDPALGVSNYIIPSLATGATKPLTSAQIPKLTASNQCTTAGVFENIATASATYNGDAVTASNSAWLKCNVTTSCIDITKDISIDGGLTWKSADNQASAPAAIAPSAADYRLTVKNCGTNTLSNVSVNDNTLGISNFSVGTMAKATSKTFTYKEIPKLRNPLACATAGAFYNTASAKGTFSTLTVADEDTAWLVCTKPVSGGCSLTQGYWKTHTIYDGPKKRNSTWDKVGGENKLFFKTGQTWYQVLWTNPAGGNVYYTLAHQYIAATLNKLSGADTSIIDGQLLQAAALLDKYDGFPNKMTDITGSIRDSFLSLAALLDQYNNGIIGPGHCK